MIAPTDLPVVWANYLSIVGFIFLLLIVWLIPKRLIMTEASTTARWRDIRLWATGLILLQIALYITFT